MSSDCTITDQRVRVGLDATATRPPGRRRSWTVEVGHWRAEATSRRGTTDALAERLAVFLVRYQEPEVLTFRGYTAVVWLDLGDDYNAVTWRLRLIRPDGRISCSGFRAEDWDEAQAQARSSLAHGSTDWHDDHSVQEAAAYLDARPTPAGSPYGSNELYRYAAWQRAAQAAMQAGRDDWHDWASSHAKEFAVPRVDGSSASPAA
jgi:hypothetical protein